MSNFFNLDNGIFTFLSKVCDIIFLSVIWVILCIPIITIGPANTALYYATVKVIRRERGYLFREFFRSFRLNFKRGAIIGVLLTVLFAILILDLLTAWTTITANSSINSILFGIYLVISFFLLSISVYVFPVLSRFDMTVKQLIKSSALMALKHLPYTLGMIIVVAAAALGIAFIPILIVVVPATSVLINSLLMERILKKYMPKAENSEDDTRKDEWYLE
jgi:uncharacterized membrane protein YesL